MYIYVNDVCCLFGVYTCQLYRYMYIPMYECRYLSKYLYIYMSRFYIFYFPVYIFRAFNWFNSQYKSSYPSIFFSILFAFWICGKSQEPPRLGIKKKISKMKETRNATNWSTEEERVKSEISSLFLFSRFYCVFFYCHFFKALL